MSVMVTGARLVFLTVTTLLTPLYVLTRCDGNARLVGDTVTVSGTEGCAVTVPCECGCPKPRCASVRAVVAPAGAAITNIEAHNTAAPPAAKARRRLKSIRR